MTLKDGAALAFSSLRCAKVRTLLTILGLAVGVGAVLSVLTLGKAGEFRVEEEIAHLGVDKVWIRPRNDSCRLLERDVNAIRDVTGAPACASAYTASPVRHGNVHVIAQIAGFDEAMQYVHAPKLTSGRTFVKTDFEQGSPVCLVDNALQESLGEDLLGKWLAVGNRRLRIVGVMESLSTQTMAAGSGLVVLTLGTYLETFGGHISEITVAVQPGQKTESVAKQALEVLVPASGYRVVTLEKEIGAAREIVRIFVMVLVCVAAVCMLTGGIGVMNVLLISVRERQCEIGLLKALGGTNLQLGFLFLLEAVLYAGIGDVFGALLGAAMIRVFGRWIGLEVRMEISTLLPVLSATALLGVCMGVLPAVRAAKMQPVDALRRE